MNQSNRKQSSDAAQNRVVCYAPSNHSKDPAAPGYVYAADEYLPFNTKVDLILPIPLIDQFKAEEQARNLAQQLADAKERYASAQVTLTRDEDLCQFQFAGAQR